jgi:DAK2 domain fusion protein YloV
MTIDGQKFKDMVVSGANALDNSKEDINNLNVFPVPDGDTGINMSLTLSEVDTIDSDNDISNTANRISGVILRSARGNSGAILALFFRGLAKSFGGAVVAGSREFAEAFKRGTEEAYKAVMNPTEGTILTVMRECADDAIEETSKPGFKDDIVAFFERVVKKAEETLQKTPDLLPVLKQANVVDAGGSGFVTMLNGMYSELINKPVKKNDTSAKATKESADFSDFNTADIKFGYCTECIVDKSEEFKGEGTARDLYSYISSMGDSAVFIDDEEIIKLHIHTNNPGLVLEKALEFGSLAKVKIENMRNQHSELSFTPPSEEVEPKEYGFVSVCIGDGIANTFYDLGVDVIVKGGQTMNPSTQDIVNAVNNTNANTVFVFPNNKNIDMVAKQAVELIDDKRVIVISTKSVPQGISALMVFDETASPEDNEAAMNEAITMVKTLSVTHAVRDTTINNVVIKTGQALGLIDGKIRMVNDSARECIKYLGDHYKDASFITIFYGADIPERKVEKLERSMAKIAPDAEITVINGGQPLYDYIISIE